uniref:Uncharacterized protein n=1 Tax=Phlebotomus kandelakii TaxID=1109342 RepID=A0A6B2EL11_9DIPT
MDLFRKILGLNVTQEEANEKGKKKPVRDDFRKPIWFEENETDDELFDNGKFFGPHIFANPTELEKHFERHLQELLKSFDDFESGDQLKEDFGQFPSIWTTLESKGMDRDLDSEVNSGKMMAILDGVTPEKPKSPRKRLTDEETIMARIHGTEPKEEETRKPTRPRYVPKMTPMHPNFESSVPIPGAKIFGQSIMTETVRKPDGSVESRRVVRDLDGNVKTTISKTVDGETKTVTTFNAKEGKEGKQEEESADTSLDRNFYVSASGYTLPRNLW